MKIIKTISYNQEEIISNILKLHCCGDIDLDPTYSKGNFYKGIIKEPKYKSDLEPQSSEVVKANSEKLPFSSSKFNTIMYDPPFVITSKGYRDNKKGSSIIAKRFEGYTSFDQLKINYFNTLKELYRVCKNDGIVIFKCQDTVSSGKNHFSHNIIINMAIDIGFYPKDMFILLAKNRLNAFGTVWKQQCHARKYHCYFLVFEKRNCRVDYSF